MEPDAVAQVLLAAASGFCAVSSVWLFGSALRFRRLIGSGPLSLPRSLRWFWRPAGVLVVPAAHLMTGRTQDRLKKELTRCDLDSLMSAERWISIRLLHAATAATIGALISGVSGLPGGGVGLACGIAGFLWGGRWLRRRWVRRGNAILKDLPSYLDVLTLCVEAGATLTTGLRLAVEKSPPGPLKQVFERALHEIRSGRTRVEAFTSVARIYDMECLSALTAALIHSEGSGMSLGSVLRAQSQQRTAERFARAERIAMQAPVKMLGPLILCIFPCTFIVIGIPIVVRILGAASE